MNQTHWSLHRVAPLTLILLAACEEVARAPDFEAFDSAGIEVVVSHSPVGFEEPWTLSEDPIPSLALDTLAVIGSMDGSGGDAFGEVSTVVPDGEGGFLILDGQNASVSWFSKDGVLLDSVARRGEGPGEFSRPTDLEVSGDGSLLVIDPGNGRLSRFTLEDGQIRFSNQIGNPVGGSRFCVLRNRVLVHLLKQGMLVHELGLDGQLVRSMVEHQPNPGLVALGPVWKLMAEAQIDVGRVACVVDPDMVLTVGTSRPFISANSVDGDALWRESLDGFFPLEAEITSEGGLTYRRDADTGTHLAVSMLRWDDRTFLAQFEVRMAGDENPGIDFPRLESRFFDLRTGEELGRTMELPYLVASDGRFLLAVRQLPFPTVTLLERHGP